MAYNPYHSSKGTIIYQLCHIVCLWCCTCYEWWQLCHYVKKVCNYFIMLSSTSEYTEITSTWPFGFSNKWCISSKKALYMIWCTTQHGDFTVLCPSLPLWFRTNNYHVRYSRLPDNLYSNTLFAMTVSMRSKMCAQIVASDFGWSCLFLIKLKSKLMMHCLFSFSRMEFPLAIICDDAKKMIQDEFYRKLKEASFSLQ